MTKNLPPSYEEATSSIPEAFSTPSSPTAPTAATNATTNTPPPSYDNYGAKKQGISAHQEPHTDATSHPVAGNAHRGTSTANEGNVNCSNLHGTANRNNRNCSNITDCEDCVNCSNCESTTASTNCSNLRDCAAMTNCSNCRDCSGLVNQHGARGVHRTKE